MDNNKIIRDNSVLLDSVYEILMKISAEIKSSKYSSAPLIDVYNALLITYFDIENDGGF